MKCHKAKKKNFNFQLVLNGKATLSPFFCNAVGSCFVDFLKLNNSTLQFSQQYYSGKHSDYGFLHISNEEKL